MDDEELPPSPGGFIATALGNIETRLALMEGIRLSAQAKQMIGYYLFAAFDRGVRSLRDRVFDLEQSLLNKDRQIERHAERERNYLLRVSALQSQLRKYQQ